jgi:hypothetical protein
MVYNPRMGQLGASGSQGSLSDLIQRARDAVHGSVSPGAVMNMMWRGGPFAPAAAMASQGDVLNDHKGFFSKLPPTAPAPAAAGYNPRMGQHGGAAPAPAAPPVQPMDDAPQRGASPAPLPWWASGDLTKMFPGASSAPAPSAAPQDQQVNANGSIAGAMGPTSVGGAPLVNQPQSAPMPMGRPAEAPQAEPDTSFFMRNALSMRDPSTGDMIDPSGASSVRGPDLISKMMTYLHSKA